MTHIQMLNLASAGFGATGTFILFLFSWSKEPYQGASWGSDEVNAENARITARNQRRRVWQPIGLGLLTLAFVLQAWAAIATN